MKLPLHIDVFVYQHCKLRMMESYHDFLAKVIKREDSSCVKWRHMAFVGSERTETRNGEIQNDKGLSSGVQIMVPT